MNLELSGYWLDDRNMITQLRDNDIDSWYLFTFHQSMKVNDMNGISTVTISNYTESDDLFEITQIDIDNFEFHGKHLRLRKE